MKSIFIILIVLVVAHHQTESKIYKFCVLARELHNKFSFTLETIPTWMCILKAESSYSTKALHTGGPNSNGEWHFGLFQINSRYWCGKGAAGGGCHIDCAELLSDNITASVNCAKRMHKLQGFKPWNSYTKKCHTKKQLPDINSCFH